MNKAITKYTGSLMMLAMLCFAALFSSCKHENLEIPEPNANIRPAGDFIKNNYDFKLFYAALEYTGMAQELNATGPFTILALSDAAFNQEGIRTVADIQKINKDTLRRNLQYHILKGRRLLVGDIPTNAVDLRLQTMSGDELYVSSVTADDRYFFDGAMVTRQDVTLANGVLHVLNKMMKYHKGINVQNFLEGNARYSIYVAGLKKFGLWNDLAGQGPFTVFAPTDSAFKANNITKADIEALNTAQYNGRRLFGAYIMRQKHFFISDKYVFKSSEYIYSINIPDDTWLVRFGTDEGYNARIPYPQLDLMDPNGQYGLTLMGRYWPPYNNISLLPAIAGFDHRLENGIVHDIPGLMLLPQQAAN
ncbi:fasciclin domain-containing protein [Mucilaginibacter conchicola]|uniref:Fasciclin domain-containing protein n=1 Tax=Mucilaginibacter conchicola TaxID=2303333 RepID=A0A372P0P6_9SPHI|nr:fasciclin domain-containing protein [Mucilaginibacter conchicola]RFZ95479.1 fasciclin domain-containing protein [Mucilaginibacter conchicola]